MPAILDVFHRAHQVAEVAAIVFVARDVDEVNVRELCCHGSVASMKPKLW